MNSKFIKASESASARSQAEKFLPEYLKKSNPNLIDFFSMQKKQDLWCNKLQFFNTLQKIQQTNLLRKALSSLKSLLHL